MLANVLVHSYSRKRFQPYKVLSIKKKNLIADEIERIVNKGISLKKKVYKNRIVAQVQDHRRNKERDQWRGGAN